MISHKYWHILIGFALVMTLAACKKDGDDNTVKPYINGKLSFELPNFIGKSTTLTMVPKGARHPSGGKLGYYFKVSSLMNKPDTTKRMEQDGDGAFTFNFGDSLGTFTVTACAFTNEDYYAITTDRAVTIVEPGVSIKHEHLETDKWFTDDRGEEDRIYSVTEFGGYEWLKPNLSFKGRKGVQEVVGRSFKNCEVMSDVFGRYYTWEEAQTACPAGWRLPSDEEWTAAAQTITNQVLEPDAKWPGLAGAFLTYCKLNEYDLLEFWPEVRVTNMTGLSIMPMGFGEDDTRFDGAMMYATLWTSTTDKKDSNKGIYRYFVDSQPDVFIGTAKKDTFRANVRCIRDLQSNQ